MLPPQASDSTVVKNLVPPVDLAEGRPIIGPGVPAEVSEDMLQFLLIRQETRPAPSILESAPVIHLSSYFSVFTYRVRLIFSICL